MRHAARDDSGQPCAATSVLEEDDLATSHRPTKAEKALGIRVECYAGHRGEQTPRAVILAGCRIEVAEVLDAWLAPDHRYFKLRDADGDTYLVRHDERADRWELTFFRADSRQAW